jgi:predicted protein tyrosine phosphatase
LISIYNTKGPVVDENGVLGLLGCHEVLSIRFSDISNTQYDSMSKYKSRKKHLVLFSDAHAKQIIAFIDRLKDKITDLVIHCEAGISRSGAVGLFVCRYLGLDETKYRDANRKINPNQYVFDVLYKVSGMKADYESLWHKLTNA